MTTLERLEQDVASLSPEELAEFRDWFLDHEARAGDSRIEDDVASAAADGKPYTAVVKHEGDWWIGWIEEVPGVNCQERSRDALLESLRATLAEAIELNRGEARGAAGTDYEELPIAV